MGDEMSFFLLARMLWQFPAIFAVFEISFVCLAMPMPCFKFEAKALSTHLDVLFYEFRLAAHDQHQFY